MKKIWTVVVAAWALIVVLGAVVVFFVPLADAMLIRACRFSAIPKRDVPLAKKRLIEEIENTFKTAGIDGMPTVEFYPISISNREEQWDLTVKFKTTIAQALLFGSLEVYGRIVDDVIENVSEIYAKQESIAVPIAE